MTQLDLAIVYRPPLANGPYRAVIVRFIFLNTTMAKGVGKIKLGLVVNMTILANGMRAYFYKEGL